MLVLIKNVPNRIKYLNICSPMVMLLGEIQDMHRCMKQHVIKRGFRVHSFAILTACSPCFMPAADM